MMKKWLIWLTCALLFFSGWSSFAGASWAAESKSSITVTQHDDTLTISGQTDQQDPSWVPLIVKDTLGQLLYFQDVSGAGKPFEIEIEIPSWAAYGTAEAILYSTVVASDRFDLDKPQGGSKKKMNVSVRIVGADDEEILKWTTYAVTKQSSVYNLLMVACEANGLDYEVRDPENDGEQVYLVGIDGLNEFDKGPGSGWVYKVNGKGPQTSIDRYSLQAGDKVEFLYTTDMGKSEEVGSGNSSAGSAYEVETSADVSGAINQLEFAENVDSIVAITKKLLWDLSDYSIEKQQTMVPDVAVFLQAAYEHAAKLPEKKSEVMKPLDPDIQDLSGLKVNESLQEQAEFKQDLEELLENSVLYKPLLDRLKPVLLVAYPSDTQSQVMKLFVDHDAREKLQNAHASIAMVKGDLRANVQLDPRMAPTSDTIWFSVREYDDQEQTKQFEEWQSTTEDQAVPLTASFHVEASRPDAGTIELNLPITGSVDESGSPTLYTREGVDASWTPMAVKLGLTKQHIAAPAKLGADLVVADVSHSFEDVLMLGDSDREVQEAIAALYSWGIVKGTSSAEYGLYRPLTRAEFFAMLTRLDEKGAIVSNQVGAGDHQSFTKATTASAVPAQATPSHSVSAQATTDFVDVPSGSWFAPVVQAAVQKGWTSGRGPKTFAPQVAMTRAEVACLLARLAEDSNSQAAETDVSKVGPIADAQFIPAWAVNGVTEAVANQWLRADAHGNIRPNSSITRGEAAYALYRFYLTQHKQEDK